MAGVTLSSTSGVSDQFQTHFSKKLLDYAVQALKLDQFANKAPLPKNSGNKAIRFFQYGEPATTDIATLTEGTAIASSAYRKMEMSSVDATLVQYGEVIGVTDILSATDLLGTLKQASKTAGEDAALHCDTLIRNELVNEGEDSETDSRTKRYAAGNLAAEDTFTEFRGNAAADYVVTADDLLDCCTNLKVNRAPQINGSYVAVMAPQVSRDLMRNDDWLEAHKYSDVQGLYKGEAGSIHGIRIVESTNPFREDISADTDKGTHAATGAIFSTFVMGDNSYGVPALSGDTPMSPKIVITDTPDKADPLGQMTTLGFKLFYCSKLLNSNWNIVLRSFSAYA